VARTRGCLTLVQLRSPQSLKPNRPVNTLSTPQAEIHLSVGKCFTHSTFHPPSNSHSHQHPPPSPLAAGRWLLAVRRWSPVEESHIWPRLSHLEHTRLAPNSFIHLRVSRCPPVTHLPQNLSVSEGHGSCPRTNLVTPRAVPRCYPVPSILPSLRNFLFIDCSAVDLGKDVRRPLG